MPACLRSAGSCSTPRGSCAKPVPAKQTPVVVGGRKGASTEPDRLPLLMLKSESGGSEASVPWDTWTAVQEKDSVRRRGRAAATFPLPRNSPKLPIYSMRSTSSGSGELLSNGCGDMKKASGNVTPRIEVRTVKSSSRTAICRGRSQLRGQPGHEGQLHSWAGWWKGSGRTFMHAPLGGLLACGRMPWRKKTS